jgi:pimeloyl-ACP methyl ester carboxylesterase
MIRQQRIIRINNRDLHVETYAPQTPIKSNREGRYPIIFLHHGLGSTHAWRNQVPAFSAAGYRVILYDRWGYGKSEARPYLSVPSFEDDLSDLRTLLEILEIQRAILIGHSDGGSIGLYYAAQFPEQVHALVTVAAHIYLEPKMEPSVQGIQQALENDQRFRQGLQRTHGEKYESTFYNWFNGWYSPATLDWDMRPLLSGIHCPALVIQGEEDEHATLQHAIDIAENILGAELWLVRNGKHMLPQEIPREFNHRVLSFLNRFVSDKDSG